VHGDVISSSPYYVKSTNTLFVGANDGMLHAVDATTGDERFAFVPNAVTDKLFKLTTNSYAHDYYVDGEIAVSTTAETPGKNILVGALGRGGKALYALDVSNPAAFTAANVMWEYTHANLGLALGKPVIAKLNNGHSGLIVGNGYNSASERALLFIIDIDTGELIRALDTQAGSSDASNGLASPRGWDTDGNGTVDIVYAGDLLGNLWKFDLSSAAPADWASAYASGGTPVPMFTATDSAGTRQPITGMIGLGVNPRKGDPNFGKRYVFFGSGRYITASDVGNSAAQSWYGLIDAESAAIGSDRSVLRQRTIELEGTIAGNATRAFSLPTPGDMAGRQGWYVDLVSPSLGNQGERMIGEHKFFGSVLLAASMVPSSNSCKPGGEGFLNAIDPFSGAALDNLFFDANNDLRFDNSDRMGNDHRAVGSYNPGINLPSDPILIGNRLCSSGTSGGLNCPSVNNPIRSGRISWHEVVTR
jgi:type IV pilus assembly protein PilY1